MYNNTTKKHSTIKGGRWPWKKRTSTPAITPRPNSLQTRKLPLTPEEVFTRDKTLLSFGNIDRNKAEIILNSIFSDLISDGKKLMPGKRIYLLRNSSDKTNNTIKIVISYIEVKKDYSFEIKHHRVMDIEKYAEFFKKSEINKNNYFVYPINNTGGTDGSGDTGDKYEYKQYAEINFSELAKHRGLTVPGIENKSRLNLIGGSRKTKRRRSSSKKSFLILKKKSLTRKNSKSKRRKTVKRRK